MRGRKYKPERLGRVSISSEGGVERWVGEGLGGAG